MYRVGQIEHFTCFFLDKNIPIFEWFKTNMAAWQLVGYRSPQKLLKFFFG